MPNWAWLIVGAVGGAALGGVVGYLGKCRGGACPLTSTPLSGIIFGGLAGLLVTMVLGPGRRAEADSPNLVLITSSEQFESAVLESDKPVLVDFYADWCPPCRRLAPVIAQLADEYAGRAVVAKVDVDALPELAQQYQVSSIPDIRIFRGGEMVETLSVADVRVYRASLDEALRHSGGQAAPDTDQPDTNQTERSNDE
jgi:thioredoxin 1